MAVTQNNYTGDGSTVLYSFTFPYLATTDVKVKLDGVNTTAYSLANATTVQLNSAPANGVKIIIFRNTDNDNKKATFYPGSAIKAEDLNNNIDQILYVAQEVDNNAMSSLGDTAMQGDLEMGQGMGIVFEGSTTDDFETRLAVANPTADRTVTLPNVTGTVVTTGDTGTVTSAMITDATIVNADINASAAIAQSKLNIANATTSAAGYESAADKTKLDGIETAATADQTAAEIRTLVESATDSNVFTDADHSKLNAIEASATADQTAAEIRTLVGNASNSNVFTDAESTKLAGIEAGATEDQTASEIKTLIASSPLDASHLAANSVGDSEIATGALDNRYYTEAESDARYFNVSTGDTIKDGDAFPDNDTTIATTAAINDRIIDLVDDVGGFVPIANETSFPNANPDVNNGTGTLVSIKALSSNLTSNGSGVATIANGTVGNSTVTINGLANSTTYAATFGMIVETTTTLNTYTFHRLVPKATEVTTVAGSISNVNSVASNISNVNSVAGNASNINSTVSNASNINTVAGSISNVNTVSTNISSVNDFADKYRIASSAPGSNNDDGDLYYNTSDNKLYVYNGSAWEVASSLNGSGGSVTGDTTFSDNTKLKLGTGDDLQIYHNGSSSYIDEVGTGSLKIQTNGTGVDIQKGSSETIARFIADGAVELYYDNSKKIQTASYGLDILDDVVFDNGTNAGKDINWIEASNKMRWQDDVKATFGAGDDLEIYHNGNNSKIDNSTGTLYIQGDVVSLAGGGGSENLAVFTKNGSNELYYDNVKKFQTESWGAQFFDDVKFDNPDTAGRDVTWSPSNDYMRWQDSTKAVFGDGEDLQIYHDGTNSYIRDTGTGALYVDGSSVRFRNYANSNTMAQFIGDGQCELYHNNVKKFETNADGTLTQGTIQVDGAEGGTAQIRMHADEGDDNADKWRFISNTDGTFGLQNMASGSYEDSIKATGNGAVEIYHDNSKKFNTLSDGIHVHGRIQLNDDGKLKVGDSGDLEIYHDGSDSYINNTTGDMWYRTYGPMYFLNSWDSEYYAKFKPNNTVELYYDGSKKFETTAGGTIVTGTLGTTGTITGGGHIKTGSDTGYFLAGASNDLQIYHDGSHSYLHQSGTGELKNRAAIWKVVNEANSEIQIKATENAAVELYYDNSLRLSTASGGVSFTNGHLSGGDNNYLILGTGNDLQIYHDGTHSNLNNSTGNLRLQSDGIRIHSQDNSEAFISANKNSAVDLYFDNVKHFETTATGVSWGTTRLRCDDNGMIEFGTGQDLQIYHDGSNSFINNTTGEIRTNDTWRWDDSAKATFGYSNDLQLYHNGTENIIATNNSAVLQILCNGTEKGIEVNPNGNVELYHDNSKKLQTTANGVEITSATAALVLQSTSNGTSPALTLTSDATAAQKGSISYTHLNSAWVSGYNEAFRITGTETNLALDVQGAIYIPDSGTKDAKLIIGTGNDLQIYHDGSNSYIDNTTGTLRIRDSEVRICNTDNETYFAGTANGESKLYYDDVLKFETVSEGVDVKGRLTTSGDYNYLKGTSSTTSTLTLKKSDANADSIDFLQCRRNSNGLYLNIEGDGDVKNHNNSYGSTSDSKLKENIVDANSQWDDIKAVKVRNFNFKASTGMPTDKHIGVIAQEIETVSAGLVKESIDRDPDTNADLGTKTKSVKYSILYMKAIKALQEAMAKIEVLETKVAALESS